MYKVLMYKKEKLNSVFSNGGLDSIDAITTRLSYWFEVRRNPQDAQFIIVDVENDRIIGSPITKEQVDLYMTQKKLDAL